MRQAVERSRSEVAAAACNLPAGCSFQNAQRRTLRFHWPGILRQMSTNDKNKNKNETTERWQHLMISTSRLVLPRCAHAICSRHQTLTHRPHISNGKQSIARASRHTVLPCIGSTIQTTLIPGGACDMGCWGHGRDGSHETCIGNGFNVACKRCH
jgi:hypothetical protein